MTLRVLIMVFLVFTCTAHIAASQEDKFAPVQNDGFPQIVKKALGGNIKIIRMDEPDKTRIGGWKQIRVWVETVYGETPVMFYSTDDGKHYFAGSIYDAEGNNLTRLDVGTTNPKVIKDADMALNPDYMIGEKDAPVKAALWIGTDPHSRQIFEAFHELYKENKDKIVLYIKFFPKSRHEIEKMTALTCFKGDALVPALQIIYDANPQWGSKDDLEAYRKTGDLGACSEELVKADLKLAETLKLPVHSVAFVNGVMLLDTPTRENIMKLAGTDFK